MGIDTLAQVPTGLIESQQREDELAVVHETREMFLNTIKERMDQLTALGTFPMIGHFSAIENLELMAQKANDPAFGKNAFRIRSVEALEMLGIEPNRAWSYGDGEISFYRNCITMQESANDYSGLPPRDLWPTAPEVIGTPENTEDGHFFVMAPWYVTLRHQIENYYGKNGREGANQKSNRDRELIMVPSIQPSSPLETIIESGLGLLEEDVQIVIFKKDYKKVQKMLEGVNDDKTKEMLDSKITYLDDSQAREAGNNFSNNDYWKTYLHWINNQGWADSSRLTETAAIMSFANPDLGGSYQFFMKPIERSDKLWPLNPVLDQEGFLHLSHQVMRSLYLEGNLCPLAEEFFDKSLQVLGVNYSEAEYQLLKRKERYRAISATVYDRLVGVVKGDSPEKKDNIEFRQKSDNKEISKYRLIIDKKTGYEIKFDDLGMMEAQMWREWFNNGRRCGENCRIDEDGLVADLIISNTQSEALNKRQVPGKVVTAQAKYNDVFELEMVGFGGQTGAITFLKDEIVALRGGEVITKTDEISGRTFEAKQVNGYFMIKIVLGKDNMYINFPLNDKAVYSSLMDQARGGARIFNVS